MVGFSLCCDQTDSVLFELEKKIVNRSKALITLLENLDEEFLEKISQEKGLKEIKVGDVFHCCMIGIHEKHEKKGIAQAMLKEEIILAKTLGYKYSYCEASSTASFNLFVKYNFSPVLTCDPKEFEYEGTRPYQHLTDPIVILVLNLQTGIQYQ